MKSVDDDSAVRACGGVSFRVFEMGLRVFGVSENVEVSGFLLVL